MPLPSWLYGNALGNIGDAAGTFPPPPVFKVLGNIGERTAEPTAPYIGAFGPRSVTGPGRGSPGGPPVQAREASNLALVRERHQRALEDYPGLAATLARNRSAEIGPNASPEKRAWYDALVFDRAAARGEPLDYTLTNPAYFPPTTTGYRGKVGNYASDPALFEGANPANFGTGNASIDPRTGRPVGFGGGPQTGSIGEGWNPERSGIEKIDMPFARAMGYTGPDVTPIGTGAGAPLGMDASQLTSGGWNTTVAAPAGGASPGAVGYTPPELAARGARTDPAELVRPEETGFDWTKLISGLKYNPKQIKAVEPFQFDRPIMRMTPIGRRRAQS